MISLFAFLVVFETRSIIGWIIIGLLAGWLAGKITKGSGFGCIGNVLLGLVGAVLGGWIFARFFHVEFLGFWGTFAAATVGAVLLVTIGDCLRAGRRSKGYPRLLKSLRLTLRPPRRTSRGPSAERNALRAVSRPTAEAMGYFRPPFQGYPKWKTSEKRGMPRHDGCPFQYRQRAGQAPPLQKPVIARA